MIPAIAAHAGRRAHAVDAAVLVATKALLGAYVLLGCGFEQVSDDDYARTVIAELFAHAPRLDPSGTSWLPLPFWIAGSLMAIVGRSLTVARAVAVILGAASVVAPYAAMRAAGVARWTSVVATAVAMALPWNAWLGVAPVPEGWAGALGAAGAMAMAAPGARPLAALALLAASLSRYEAWPACAVLAVACALSSARAARSNQKKAARMQAACAALALAGPAAWMAWNAHAHGSATHFVTRVTAFRRAIGAADVPLAEKLLDYPHALVVETPDVALLALAGLAGLAASRGLWRRWAWPAIASAAVLAFLIAGDVRDGAPTHHPERALSIVWWTLAAMGIDAGSAALRNMAPLLRPAVAALGLVWCATLVLRYRGVPGATEAERRDTQIALGLELRARHIAAVEVTPCAYEHFAVLAAWGAPERAVVHPPSHAQLTPACPRLEPPLTPRSE
ncbi:MAG: hypothetical protein FWD17_17790 [Polyangiaceae bacterium]|nr:hypothetical protein [Polyangiaceae bacterium]